MSSDDHPFLSRAEPILPVSDLLKTVDYWHNVLGFHDTWTWGEPPNYGGAVWNDAAIQFSLNPALASASKGNAIFIRVKKLQSLYEFHQTNNAEIVEPLENKPWGMAGYTVREINGYYISFGGEMIDERKKSDPVSSQNVKIIPRTPTTKEYLNLIDVVGWGKYREQELDEKTLKAPLFAVIAEDESTREVIGCALLLSDGASFYYVKDVMVNPAWQNKNVGSKLMKAITDWLDQNAPEHAFICLITPPHLEAFYKHFDFTPAFAMVRKVREKKETTKER